MGERKSGNASGYAEGTLGPTRSAMIRCEDGTLCTTTDQCWRDHFSPILNICCSYSPAELDKGNPIPVVASMGDPSMMKEMMQAVGKLKPGKAGGSSGVLPELVKASCIDAGFRDILLDMILCAWREQQVP